METVEPDDLLTMVVPMEAGERRHQLRAGRSTSHGRTNGGRGEPPSGKGGELAPMHDNSRPLVAPAREGTTSREVRMGRRFQIGRAHV